MNCITLLVKTPSVTMAGNISWNLRILICGVMVLYAGKVVTGRFVISPQRIVFGGENPTSQINFTCTPNIVGMNYPLGFDIGKVSPDGTKSSDVKKEVVNPVENGYFTVNGTGQRSDDYFYVQGYTGYQNYFLRELRCSDVGTYYCASTMMGSGNFSGVKSTVTVEEIVKVDGGQDGIKMTIHPDKKAYDVNENIEIKCSGTISSKFDEDMLKDWVWERFENKKWIEIPKSDINHKNPTPATNCSFHSTLQYKVDSADHGRKFRCYLKDRENAANKTISLVGMVGGGDTKEINIAVLVTSVMLVMILRN